MKNLKNKNLEENLLKDETLIVEKRFKKLSIDENQELKRFLSSKEQNLILKENEIYGYKNFCNQEKIIPLKSTGPFNLNWKVKELIRYGEKIIPAPFGLLPKDYNIEIPKNFEDLKKITFKNCDELICFYGLYNNKTGKSFGSYEIDFDLKKEILIKFLCGII